MSEERDQQQAAELAEHYGVPLAMVRDALTREITSDNAARWQAKIEDLIGEIGGLYVSPPVRYWLNYVSDRLRAVLDDR